MTDETDFQAWRVEFAERCGVSPDALRYELTDADGNRRLNEVIESANTAASADDQSDSESALFKFTPHDPDIGRRYRFQTLNDVQSWYTVQFDIAEIHGEVVDTEAGYTLEIGFSTRDELEETLIGRDNGSTEVAVFHETFADGYLSRREFRVAGLSEQREMIQEFIRADGSRWGMSPGHGLLLEGPPGTGKTEIVMEVCREEFGAVPVEISGPEILSRWLGESERVLRERFEQARTTPSNILYIDEIDAIARSRGKSTQEHSAQIVAQLLVLLDGLESKRGEAPVKVIASTNMAKLIDEALRRPGRLGRTVSFKSLSGTDTLAVLHHYLEQIHRNQVQSTATSTDIGVGRLSPELEAFVTAGDVEQLNQQGAVDDVQQFLSGRTGADIEQLVQQATRHADDNSNNGSPSVLEPTHLFETPSGTSGMGNVISGSSVEAGRSRFINSRVLRISPEEGHEEVRKEFEKFLRDHDEYEEGVFRTIRLTEELFSVGEDGVWSQIWEHFRAERGYPVCVYFHDYEQISQVADYSSIAQAIIEALCERLITEPDSSSPPVLFGYASPADSHAPRIEEFAADWDN